MMINGTLVTQLHARQLSETGWPLVQLEQLVGHGYEHCDRFWAQATPEMRQLPEAPIADNFSVNTPKGLFPICHPISRLMIEAIQARWRIKQMTN